MEEFDIGDLVWLYIPAVKPGQSKKLSSMWKGPYTVIDMCRPVDYKIQLIGGTQLLVVHQNRLKPCYGAPSPAVSYTPTPAPTSSTLTEQAKCDSRSIGGYTTVRTAAVNPQYGTVTTSVTKSFCLRGHKN